MSDEDHEVVKAKNSLIALRQIKSMGSDEKKEFASLMSRMIVVDEDINANEVSIYDVVAEFCGIDIAFEDAVEKEKRDACTKS